MKKSARHPEVVAATEGPFNCKVRHHLMGAPTAGARSVASLGMTCFSARL
jgi:hypothetical protein